MQRLESHRQEPTPNNDGNFNATPGHLCNLPGYSLQHRRVDTELVAAFQRLPADLQHHPFVLEARVDQLRPT